MWHSNTTQSTQILNTGSYSHSTSRTTTFNTNAPHAGTWRACTFDVPAERVKNLLKAEYGGIMPADHMVVMFCNNFIAIRPHCRIAHYCSELIGKKFRKGPPPVGKDAHPRSSASAWQWG